MDPCNLPWKVDVGGKRRGVNDTCNVTPVCVFFVYFRRYRVFLYV